MIIINLNTLPGTVKCDKCNAEETIPVQPENLPHNKKLKLFKEYVDDFKARHSLCL